LSNLDGGGHIYYFFSISNIFTIDEELFENEKKYLRKLIDIILTRITNKVFKLLNIEKTFKI
jgi:hypothetical protein